MDEMWNYAINETGGLGEIIVVFVVIGIPTIMALLLLCDYLKQN